MRAVVAVLAFAFGCTYGDPAVEGSFKCDDTHRCPAGETCTGGVCSGGGSSSAAGIVCGDTTCGPGMQCCAGPIASPVCQLAGAECSAGGVAACDGLEDCGNDEACCGTTDAACGPASCSPRACQTSDDCAGAASNNCCFTLSYLPWGFCC